MVVVKEHVSHEKRGSSALGEESMVKVAHGRPNERCSATNINTGRRGLLTSGISIN